MSAECPLSASTGDETKPHVPTALSSRHLSRATLVNARQHFLAVQTDEQRRPAARGRELRETAVKKGI